MQGLRLFVCHDPVDLDLCERFEKVLAPLKRAGVLSTWSTRCIMPGEKIAERMEDGFLNAHVLVLLVSVDLLSSNVFWDFHDRAAERKMGIVPVLIRTAAWETTPLKDRQVLPRNKVPVTRWPEADEAWTHIAGELSKQTSSLAMSSVEELPTDTWSISQPTRTFTGREAELQQLRDRLLAGGVQVISGLGGIGKTELALTYAHRFRDDYQVGLYLPAESESALQAGLARIARQLRLGVDDDPPEQGRAVQRWLDRHEQWLLLIDNADQVDRVLPWCISGRRGHVVITTRASSCLHLGTEVFLTLSQLAPTDALGLLKRVIGRGELEQPALEQLADTLGGMPLALTHAASHIRAQRVPVADYLKSFLLRRSAHLKGKPYADRYKAAVAATWAMNIEAVRRESAPAAALMACCSFLRPDAIPEEIFVNGGATLGEELEAAFSGAEQDPLCMGEVLEPLFRYSLIERDPTERTLRVHRLVQATIQEDLPAEARRRWAERVIHALCQIFPQPPAYSKWARCRRLITHVVACGPSIEELGMAGEQVGSLLSDAGQFLLEQAQYQEANLLLMQSVAVWARTPTSVRSHKAATLNKLGWLRQSQGLYEEAEEFYQQALRLCEQEQGSEYQLVACVLENLALLYGRRGHSARCGSTLRCEELHERALKIREQTLGPNHPDVAESLNNLALYYLDTGRRGAAEPLCRRALAIREGSLAPDHPAVSSSLNSLAGILMARGQFSEAELLHRRVLANREKTLRPDHPRIADSLNNLAVACLHQGKREEAEPLLCRALAINEKTLGSEHTDIAQSLNNLAVLYLHQNKYEEAEPLLGRALALAEKAFGAVHRDVARILVALGYVNGQLGRDESALELLQRALAILETVLGSQHPALVETCDHLAVVAQRLGRSADAAAFKERAALIRHATERTG